MSSEKKTRLEVQNLLKKTIEDGMSAMGHNGWMVMEFANASFQNSNKIVLMNLIGTKRVGWQGRSYSPHQEWLVMRESWIEEQKWQIHCIRKRPTSDADPGILAEDVASDLVTWFNGAGCERLRQRGMANLRIDSDSVIVYNDNSDLYQKRAVFTVKIQVPKEMRAKNIGLDTLVPKIMPV